MVQVRVRNVPGDGNCLFHSISVCMAHADYGATIDYYSPRDWEWLQQNSSWLRQQAVDCLREGEKTLFVQGHESIKAKELVRAVATRYGLTPNEYLDSMQQDGVWGGGVEIVALSNVLKRAIHVYELASSLGSQGGSDEFVLRRMAYWGSPKFETKEPFHILSADPRFPELTPGEQNPSGSHFMAAFLVPEQEAEYLKVKALL
jgi:OTU-like cysteine protease